MLFEFFVGVSQSNVVNYDKQHNYNTIWKVLGPELTVYDYEMEESISFPEPSLPLSSETDAGGSGKIQNRNQTTNVNLVSRK